VAACTLCVAWSATAGEVAVASPNGAVQFRLTADGGRLTYAVTLAGKPAVEPSPLAITLDGASLTDGADVGEVSRIR
jgi:Glycosyl-hydrolase 97 N-terminal